MGLLAFPGRDLFWWLLWSTVTAFGYCGGALAGWGIERYVMASLQTQMRATTLDDMWQSVVVSSVLFGILLAAVQFPVAHMLFPRVAAWRWMIATMFGWSVDGLTQWLSASPVCWLPISLWLGPLMWIMQVRMLQPGMPSAFHWLIATIVTRWLVNSVLFQPVRERFEVIGGPLAMAEMSAILGFCFGAITGVVLLILARPAGLNENMVTDDTEIG